MAGHYVVEGAPYFDPNARAERLDVMACLIKVWAAPAPNWFPCPPDCSVFTEVESIEIRDSIKDLIGTATIRIPRGSVFKKTKVNDEKDKAVNYGNVSKTSKNEKEVFEAEPDNKVLLSKSSVFGDVLADGMNVSVGGSRGADTGYSFSHNILRPLMGNLTREMEDWMLSDRANKNDIAVGNRIEIWMGYIHEKADGGSDSVDNQWKKLAAGDTLDLTMVFTGFITGISPLAPFEIKCENMASILKRRSCPRLEGKGTYTVRDFFKPDGKFKLLEYTGLGYFDDKGLDVQLGTVDLQTHTTVFDVLNEWKKCGIMSKMTDDGKSIKIGRMYYSGSADGETVGDLIDNSNKAKEFVQFDWDVAEDKLSVFEIDKRFLAIDGQAWRSNGKVMRVTVRRAEGEDNHPNGRTNQEEQDGWDFVNIHEGLTRKEQKRLHGQNKPQVGSTNVDLKKYYRIPFIMSGKCDSLEELKAALKTYYTKYNKNGVSGSITLFGDRVFSAGQIIGLVDPRHPEKNGYFMIESVITTFNNNGYRRELKLPYKVEVLRPSIKYIHFK